MSLLWMIAAGQCIVCSQSNETRQHPQSPLDPVESLAWLRSDARQRVELVASEPEVIDPVAMQFDDAGNIWIVEMSDYPMGPADKESPRGRIRVLEDKDLDGLYESSRVFADQLLFANGLQLYRDGVIVTAGDQLRFLRDIDGDGRADKTEIWIKGFSEQNSQLLANDPTIALDLHLYVANGLRSTMVETMDGPSTKSTDIDVRGRDLRMDLNTRTFQTVTGPSQFGMTWDRLGNRYFCSNRNPCDSVLVEQRDATLSPLAGLSPMTIPVVPAGEASSVHPLSQAWTTSTLHTGQFSAACGVLMSASNQLPPASLGNALTCEPTGSLVHRRAMHRVDGMTAVEDGPPEKEWLASLDSWFRPVNLCEGPEGAIYVVDMYRAVIEHPQFMPAELKQRPDLRTGDDRGRIYRVSEASQMYSKSLFESLRASPLGKRSTGELMELLKHPNEWMRSTAARFLADVGYIANTEGTSTRREIDPQTVAAMMQLTQSNFEIETRLRAAYLLVHWGVMDQTMISAWLDDKDSRIRTHAWKIGRTLLNPGKPVETSLYDRLSGLLDPIQNVKRDQEELVEALWCLASIVSKSESPTFDKNLGALAAQWIFKYPGNARLWLAASAATRNESALFIKQLSEGLVQGDELRKLDAWIGDDIPAVALTAIERLVPIAAKGKSNDWLAARTDVAESFGNAINKVPFRKKEIAFSLAFMSGWSRSEDRESFKTNPKLSERILSLAQDTSLERSLRISAIQLLGSLSKSQAAPLLKEIASATQDPEIFGVAVRAWSKHTDASFDKWLVERFSSSSIRQRADLFAAFLSNVERNEVLIQSLEEKKISMRSLTASQVQAIKLMKAPSLKARINALIANSMDANRAKVIDTYLPSLDMKADVERGRLVFQQQCAACHKVGTIGINVGPDISDARNQTPSQLLTNILDPNRAIDNNFFRFAALTTDGQVVEGILMEETASTITLKGQNNRVDVLDRSEIESFKSTGISMMPEGIESQIPPQAMADLIHFIKNWRYADANIPVTKPGAD